MGHPSFLVNHSGPPKSLLDSIRDLKIFSAAFVTAWRTGDMRIASDVSEQAMATLDHITNIIIRARDDEDGAGTYVGSDLETKLSKIAGSKVSPVTAAEQVGLRSSGYGNGALTPGKPVKPVKLIRLLTSIKHRQEECVNFRITSAGRHIFLICVNNPDRTPNSIVEFDVGIFADHCESTAPYV